MNSLTLKLDYPVSSNRYWQTRVITPKGGRPMAMTYVSPEAKAYKIAVAKAAQAAGVREPFKGRIQVEIWLWPHRPLDWKTRQRKLGDAWDSTVQCIDLGNCEKVLSDALNGVVYEDDKWIRRISLQRMEPDGEARVVVRITSIEPQAPQYELIGAAK